MKLFVAKLNREAKEADVQAWFEAVGPVKSVKIVMDRDTGQSKCFGFVEMASREDGERAIRELNGQALMDFRMVIKEAEERPRTAPSGGAPRRDFSQGGRDGARQASPDARPDRPRAEGFVPGAGGAGSADEAGAGPKSKKVVKKKAGKGRPDKYADGPRSVKMKRNSKGGGRPGWGDFDDDF